MEWSARRRTKGYCLLVGTELDRASVRQWPSSRNIARQSAHQPELNGSCFILLVVVIVMITAQSHSSFQRISSHR